MAHTKEQLKAMFAKKSFSKLPVQLQEEILDSAHPSGVNTTADDWNELNQMQREDFLDQYKTEELKNLKTGNIKAVDKDAILKHFMEKEIVPSPFSKRKPSPFPREKKPKVFDPIEASQT